MGSNGLSGYLGMKYSPFNVIGYIYTHMKVPTKLVEYLVRQCTKEVLDQISEGQKLNIKFAKEKQKEVPIRKKITVAGGKDTTFKPNVKKVSESEEPENTAMAPPANGQGTGDTPPIPKAAAPDASNPPEEETPEQPKPASGPVFISPKDKSKLYPLKFPARDEATIERTLHNLAAGVIGSKAKVSLGAKRLAREAASNPNAKIFFYLGKTDPESDEVFLMADKSLQIAKDESVQSSELQGTPSFLPSDPNDINSEYDPHRFSDMTDQQYDAYLAQKKRGGLKPRYDVGGLTEETNRLIAKAINKILDSK
jgi:hypothetical protein